MKVGRSLLCGVTGITIVLVLFSGCLDDSSNGNFWGSLGTSGSCSAGYHRYTTSDNHCCPEGYPYYYDGTCHSCSQGYNKYATSAGYCCPTGYPHYYDGKCHQCSQGYAKYDTSSGYCCPTGYPYYYDGKCHTQASSSYTYVVVPTGGQVDSRTGCPSYYDLQCSGWIPGSRCEIQSCTCYWSGSHGDSTSAYYHTSDNAYFRCTGTGETISCVAAAQAAAQHCM
jgi:hypothetical protein